MTVSQIIFNKKDVHVDGHDDDRVMMMMVMIMMMMMMMMMRVRQPHTPPWAPLEVSALNISVRKQDPAETTNILLQKTTLLLVFVLGFL